MVTGKIWCVLSASWFALAIFSFITLGNLELAFILVGISSIYSVGIGILSRLDKVLEKK